jgi:hypothetical protein
MHDLRVNKYSTSVTATTLLEWSRINSYGIEGYNVELLFDFTVKGDYCMLTKLLFITSFLFLKREKNTSILNAHILRSMNGLHQQNHFKTHDTLLNSNINMVYGASCRYKVRYRSFL